MKGGTMEKLNKMAELAGYEHENEARETEARKKQHEQVYAFTTVANAALTVAKENDLDPFVLFRHMSYHSGNTVQLDVGGNAPVTIRIKKVGPANERVLEAVYHVFGGTFYGKEVRTLALATYLVRKEIR